ncbi:hypothetical protein BD626DRAFT_516164 [Schizophyllum amplum]|uniref:Uncharacterized protein n=1 Tax=Schizophyllum amplum TaxID=97359 RepID=A0A550BX88_9AGAR|nr:hypothetical protein BD626DRAFT_516164 [Auriculariopsis ampla]
MKPRRGAHGTDVAARLKAPKRSRSSSSSVSYASVPYIDSLNPDEYVRHLAKTRDALQRFPQVPRSRSPSPAICEEHGKRKGKATSLFLQGAIQDVLKAAKGNPTHGGWSQLSSLLRTSSSIGKPSYIIKRPRVLAQPPAGGWPKMFKTEEEWEEWSARRESERKIKAWQLTIEQDTAHVAHEEAPCRDKINAVAAEDLDERRIPSVRLSQQGASDAISSIASQRRAPTPSPLGFPVVKRAGRSIAHPKAKSNGHPSRKSGAQQNEQNHPLPFTHEVPLPSENVHAFEPEHAHTPVSEDLRISNFDVSSYLPPSFPTSQIMTSTPKPEEKVRRKPSPIQPIAVMSPPFILHSPPPTSPSVQSQSVAQGPATSSSSSIPGLRSSPTPSRAKRKRTAVPDAPLKRPRTERESFTETDERLYRPDSVAPVQPDDPPEHVQPHPPIPTLTALLSARRTASPSKPSPYRAGKTAAANLMFTPVSRRYSADKDDDTGRAVQGPSTHHEARMRSPSSPLEDPYGPRSAITIASSPSGMLVDSRPSTQTSRPPLAGDEQRPAPETGHAIASFDGMFDPPFTSTAADHVGHAGAPGSSLDEMALAGGSVPGGFMYNSQLEIEDKIGAASRRIDEDVDPLAWLNTFGADEVDEIEDFH